MSERIALELVESVKTAIPWLFALATVALSLKALTSPHREKLYSTQIKVFGRLASAAQEAYRGATIAEPFLLPGMDSPLGGRAVALAVDDANRFEECLMKNSLFLPDAVIKDSWEFLATLRARTTTGSERSGAYTKLVSGMRRHVGTNKLGKDNLKLIGESLKEPRKQEAS